MASEKGGGACYGCMKLKINTYYCLEKLCNFGFGIRKLKIKKIKNSIDNNNAAWYNINIRSLATVR